MSTQPLPTPVAAPPPSEGQRMRLSAFERVQGLAFVLPALAVLSIFLI